MVSFFFFFQNTALKHLTEDDSLQFWAKQAKYTERMKKKNFTAQITSTNQLIIICDLLSLCIKENRLPQ